MSALRRGIVALAAAAGFATVCGALTLAVAPAPADSMLRAAWLSENGTRFDTVFVGSSRTLRQRATEDAFVLDRALGARTEPLQFVIVECNPVRLGIPLQDRGTLRAVYWHDGPRVRTLWNRVWARPSLSPDAPTGIRVLAGHLGAFAVHVRAWIWNALRLGRAPEIFAARLRVDAPHPPTPGLGPRSDGYDPGRLRPLMEGEELEDYRRELDGELRDGKPNHFGDTESQAELARKRDVAARFGARLVLVAPPTVGEAFAPLPDRGFLFLDFSDPRRYPELFAVEHRNDRGHLNRTGALLYSRLLARELARGLDGARG